MENDFDALAQDFALALADQDKPHRWTDETFTESGSCGVYIVKTGLSWWLNPEDYAHLTFDYRYQYKNECGNDRCARPDCGLTETGKVTVYGNGVQYSYAYNEYGQLQTA